MEFTGKLIQLRRSHPNLHRRKFFQDRDIRGSVDVAWYSTDGKQFGDQDWSQPWNKSLALLLNGKTLNVSDDEGNEVKDDTFLILINAAPDGVEFKLPQPLNGSPWKLVMKTENIEDPFAGGKLDKDIIVGGRSMVLLSDGE